MTNQCGTHGHTNTHTHRHIGTHCCSKEIQLGICERGCRVILILNEKPWIETACRGVCEVKCGSTVIQEGPKQHLPCHTYGTRRRTSIPPSSPSPSPKWSTEPVISTPVVLVLVVGAGEVASQLTWRGSHRDKSQFTQGAVTLNDIFTGCLYSSFDNAPATSFISLKDESKAGNAISPLRQGRGRLKIKEEGGAS